MKEIKLQQFMIDAAPMYSKMRGDFSGNPVNFSSIITEETRELAAWDIVGQWAGKNVQKACTGIVHKFASAVSEIEPTDKFSSQSQIESLTVGGGFVVCNPSLAMDCWFGEGQGKRNLIYGVMDQIGEAEFVVEKAVALKDAPRDAGGRMPYRYIFPSDRIAILPERVVAYSKPVISCEECEVELNGESVKATKVSVATHISVCTDGLVVLSI